MTVPIPDRILKSLHRYSTDHVPTGDFLRAVLSNDLFGAVRRADDESLKAIGEICKHVYNELPAECWGSREVVAKWIEQGSRNTYSNLETEP